MKFRFLTAAALSAVFFQIGALAADPVKESVKVLAEYPHDVSSYTQGLFFWNGDLYESTGTYGKSTFRKVELSSGKALRRLDFGKQYFAEGSVVLGSNLYILTWTNKLAFVYDAATLKYKQSYSYPREGWGLTTDGKSLIASDGSSKLYFMGEDFKLQRTVSVTVYGRALKFLNELEWIDGKIWANVYTTDMIVVIDPATGVVEKILDCSGLLPDSLRKPSTDVLNGIAYDPEGRKLYVTGKNWPRMYQIKFQ